MLIKDVLEDLGASSVLISLDETKNTGKVSLDYSGDKRNIISAIKKEGYKVK